MAAEFEYEDDECGFAFESENEYVEDDIDMCRFFEELMY